MRSFVLVAASAALVVWMLGAQEKPAPAKLVFKSKMGDVTFNHAEHSKRVKEDCKTCHPKVFPQSQAPLGFKDAMHKKSEAAKTSCAHCHVAGGASFEAKGNCNKCHVKAAAKG